MHSCDPFGKSGFPVRFVPLFHSVFLGSGSTKARNMPKAFFDNITNDYKAIATAISP